MKKLFVAGALLVGGMIPFVPAQAEMNSYAVAVLQGLNKVTARVSEFEVPLNQPVLFGSLEITAQSCRKSPPEEAPEATSFLEISDVSSDGERKPMFSGWMFASSPAISALEHPVYDVWVLDCRPATKP
ncbi:DUF2155 domain-containing protein [Kiloniella laminariae]|uniref:DUF2155 domain-containing protein n=1 Tax=Kiloniella laminariae TaxID=454162 RepID=UPI000376758E|nr:DUF2155 domain-containing protein [Kiloniella laminariae]